MATNSLDVFFSPHTVAVIGASDQPNSVGGAVLRNLVSQHFDGTVYPVNAKRDQVQGIKAYPNISSVPEFVDLVVVATPAQTVPGIIKECGERGVRAAVVLSAGFDEIGEEGVRLGRDLVEEGKKFGLRVLGPNCVGVISPRYKLNATFASSMPNVGSVAFLSQSGALCTAILDWSLREKVGFSAFVSVGAMLDVGWADLIDHFGSDPNTSAILLYMESIGDARAFLSAAREVSLHKPIIVLKAGRSEAAARAAASHTGALAGSDKVLDAAFARAGVLRVNSIAELFYMAEALSKQPRPHGPRLTILTNAGGPGVLATDALQSGGGRLTDLAPETVEALNKILPSAWSHNNPVDTLGDASPQRYADTARIVLDDPNTDALLAILTPQAMTDPTGSATMLASVAKGASKPVLASWMGGDIVAEGVEILKTMGIPCFPYPDTAARIANMMWRYTAALHDLYETPHPPVVDKRLDRKGAAEIISHARKSGRTLLSEYESKQLLAAYGIPTVETRIAISPDEAAQAATEIGFPVVLKLHSETITHKTDVKGVLLNLQTVEEVRQGFADIEAAVQEKAGPGHFNGVTVQPMVKLTGYELIIGSNTDVQFGPVLLFGSGGQLVETLRDTTLALPPLNSTLARRMMERTRIYKALKGVRGRAPVPLDQLEDLMVRFSKLVAEEPAISDIEINPLLASPEGLCALDARVILYGCDVKDDDLPKPAIEPFPAGYVRSWTAPDGALLEIRPIQPEDEPMMVKFHGTLSEKTVYLRYFHLIDLEDRIAHERLIRMCQIDYDRQMAFVAVHRDTKTGQPELLGIGRLMKSPDDEPSEFAIVVSDDVQGNGVGTELMRRLILFAHDSQITRISGSVLTDNDAMLRVCEKLGFQVHYDYEEKIIKVEISPAEFVKNRPEISSDF